MNQAADIFRYRDLLIAWTGRVIRARYKQSIIGGLWAVLQPAASVAIFSIIFTRFLRVDTGTIPYVVFSFTAMVPWLLFSSSVSDMIDSLTANMNLVSKIYFPREILVIAAMLARLFDFGIAFTILLLLIFAYRIPVSPTGLIFIPLILAVQLALSLGLGLAGAALNVFYRDVKHLITLGLQIWLYASPIIYPVSLVPENLRRVYFLNPMAGVIEAYRSVLLYQKLPDSSLAFSALMSAAVLLLGYLFFKRVERQFADVV
jgi:lipopolysaccharide transport system permease protein